MEKALWYIFILSLVLVALAYYVGLKSDSKALGTAFTNLIYALTGRSSGGKFAGYPGGAATAA